MKDISFGEWLADKFTTIVGSWTFIAFQTVILISWLILNLSFLFIQWDPYPFILLNLFLSFQAAYTGPIIMMSQNRQSQIDRETMVKDYELSEESFKYLEKITKIMEAYEKDRKKQFKILKNILEEIEDDDA